MNKKIGNYQLSEDLSEGDIRYFFLSEGKVNVIKAIEYTFVQAQDGALFFNLAFGDYDIGTDNIIDETNTNNGDHYKVFNTILHSIQQFFRVNNDAVLMISGSDSNQAYLDNCKLNCRKKCVSGCKNFNRRINIYRRYLDKNYEILKNDYEFFGEKSNTINHIELEKYIIQKNYTSLFVIKKKS